MPQYTIIGVNKETGLHTDLVLEAPDAHAAVALASNQGVTVVSLEGVLQREDKEPARPDSSTATVLKQTKACPFCAEEILVAAIKCKHCGEFLDFRNSNSETAQPSQTKKGHDARGYTAPARSLSKRSTGRSKNRK